MKGFRAIVSFNYELNYLSRLPAFPIFARARARVNGEKDGGSYLKSYSPGTTGVCNIEF